MTELFDLPEEILQYICAFLVSGHGIQNVVKTRETCRLFDRLIIFATWKTSALELTERPLSCGEAFVVKCLYGRTITDWKQKRHKFTKVASETIEFLQQAFRAELVSDCDYILEACSAATSAHKYAGSWRELYTLDPRQVMNEFEITHTVQENALAFAVHLGLFPIVERLIDEGTRGRYTCFGSPLDCAAKYRDSDMMKTYLNARLKLQERCGPAFSVVGRRDISRSDYEMSMENAMSFGTLETVQLLLEAASYDEQFPSYGLESWHSIRKKPGWSNETHQWSSVLWYATRKLNLPLAKFALDHGADPNICPPGRDWAHSALENAARRGSLELFNLLLDHGADMHVTYHDNLGLLSRAVSGGSLEIVTACLDAGVQDHATRFICFHPLVGAVTRNSPKMLQLLLDRGVDFTIGSVLDEELKKAAGMIANPDIDAILKLARDSRPDTSAEPNERDQFESMTTSFDSEQA